MRYTTHILSVLAVCTTTSMANAQDFGIFNPFRANYSTNQMNSWNPGGYIQYQQPVYGVSPSYSTQTTPCYSGNCSPDYYTSTPYSNSSAYGQYSNCSTGQCQPVMYQSNSPYSPVGSATQAGFCTTGQCRQIPVRNRDYPSQYPLNSTIPLSGSQSNYGISTIPSPNSPIYQNGRHSTGYGPTTVPTYGTSIPQQFGANPYYN